MSKRGLVYCGDPYHPASDAIDALSAVGREEFSFDVAGSGGAPGLGKGFDFIVVAKCNVTSPGDRTPWMGVEADAAVSELVHDGMGLVVIHGGTVGYAPCRSMRAMTCGEFVTHPDPCAVTIEPVDGIGVDAFDIFDEHYFVQVDPQAEVFLRSRSIHGVQPAGWTHTFGRGRVWVMTPGHFTSVWTHPSYRQFLKSALEWVTHG